MNHEGIGLGLTIVKQLVELNKGSIGVHSEGSGKGSAFCFTMKMEMLDEEPEPENSLLDLAYEQSESLLDTQEICNIHSQSSEANSAHISFSPMLH